MKKIIVLFLIIFGALMIVTDYHLFLNNRHVKLKKMIKVEEKHPCGYIKFEYDSAIDCYGKKIHVKPISLRTNVE